MKVSVLGTGVMGTGVVHSLLRDGHDVTVWNRTADKAQPLAGDGATVAPSITAAVDGSEVVLFTLYDADSVLSALGEIPSGENGGPVVVQASTIGLDGTAEVVKVAGDKGIRLVEAMMLGTKKPAEDGQLVLLTAGDPALLEEAKPALDAISARVVETGPAIGSGTALKLACNAWIAVVNAGVAQSVALAQALGVDPQLFLDAIKGGAVDAPYAHLKGAAMMSGDFTPSFALDGVRKDLGVITDAARGAGVSTTVLDALQSVFGEASQAGYGADDMAAVYRAFTPADERR